MPDYKKMYTTLFNAVTDTIEKLQKAQQETEEMYVENGVEVAEETEKNAAYVPKA